MFRKKAVVNRLEVKTHTFQETPHNDMSTVLSEPQAPGRVFRGREREGERKGETDLILVV